MNFYCDEKMDGDKFILAYLYFDRSVFDNIVCTLKDLQKKNNSFRFHAVEDTKDKKTQKESLFFKRFIESSISELCDKGKIIFSSHKFKNELDAYKWIAQEMPFKKSETLYRDEGKFKKENENLIRHYFSHKKIRLISQKKDRNSTIAQTIGIVDYILYYDIKLHMTKKPRY